MGLLAARRTLFGARSSLRQGLVAEYSFEEGTGPTAYDSIGQNHGTWAGTGASTSSVSTTGILGKAGLFDGSTNQVTLPNTSALKLASGSISVWLKTSSPGASLRGVVSKTNAYNLYLSAGTLGTYDFTAATFRTTGINVADGAWHHLGVSWQSGVTNGTTVYHNGLAVLSTTMTVVNQTTAVAIGGVAGQFLAGSIDEVLLYLRLLAAAEMTMLYNAGAGRRP